MRFGRAETGVILVFGDSISAGYGLERVEQAGWHCCKRDSSSKGTVTR